MSKQKPSMRGQLRELEKQVSQPAQRGLSPRDWFVGESAETIARKAEVWGLLRWYHHRYVLPNLGLRGWIRRTWVMLTGHKIKIGDRRVNLELLALTSPWEHWEAKRAIDAAMAELERCPIGFLEDGKSEPIPCELPRGHEGNHVSGSFSWADQQAPQTPAPPGPVVEA